MDVSTRARPPRPFPTAGRRVASQSHAHLLVEQSLVLALTVSLAAGLLIVNVTGCGGAPPTIMEAAAPLPGTASLSGTVASAAPFTAAQVYIRNVDERMLYMVYTQAGHFRAVALFPGNYEVGVTAKGLESDVQHLVLNAGDNASLDLSLRESSGTSAPEATGGGQEMPARPRAAAEYLSYDDLYPPGPGRDVAERTCMPCARGHRRRPGDASDPCGG